jgi:tripartite-type tricarboxylate transporter receptor subunit TctC
VLFAALAAVCVAPGLALADDYPDKPIKIIVPFGPGSGSDIIARGLGIYLQERFKQVVIIDNRPGANGMIGAEALKNAVPDGYTLGISTNSTHAAAPFLIRKLAYDPLQDFEHIGLIGVGGAVGLIPLTSPFKTIAELAAYAKAHPGHVFFGHADTISQLPGELLKTKAELPIQGVAYKTISTVIADLRGGHIQLAFVNYMTGAAQVTGGQLLPIAISEGRRNPKWPGTPTLAESYPGLEVILFAGLSAPRGVPSEIVSTLNRALQDAQRDARFKAPLDNVGLMLSSGTAQQYREFLFKESERWREYIRAAKIEAQ